MYHKSTIIENATKLTIAQDAWLLLKFKNPELIRLYQAPGETMENHIHELRPLFFVLRGSGTLEMEGELFQMEAKQSIAVKSGRERLRKNTGDAAMEILAIKTLEEE